MGYRYPNFEAHYDRLVTYLNEWESNPGLAEEDRYQGAEKLLAKFEVSDWHDLQKDWTNHSKTWQLHLIGAISCRPYFRYVEAWGKLVLGEIILSPDDEVSAKAAAKVARYFRDEHLPQIPELYRRLSQTVLNCSDNQKQSIADLLKAIKPFI
jgi:hypothetical protein